MLKFSFMGLLYFKTNLCLPALSPNFCLPALASNFYLRALPQNFYLPVLAQNFITSSEPEFAYTDPPRPPPNLYLLVLVYDVYYRVGPESAFTLLLVVVVAVVVAILLVVVIPIN